MEIANVGIFKDETALNQRLMAMLAELMFLFNVAFWSYQRHRMEFKDKNRRCDTNCDIVSSLCAVKVVDTITR